MGEGCAILRGCETGSSARVPDGENELEVAMITHLRLGFSSRKGSCDGKVNVVEEYLCFRYHVEVRLGLCGVTVSAQAATPGQRAQHPQPRWTSAENDEIIA